jgi:hypothetical protein
MANASLNKSKLGLRTYPKSHAILNVIHGHIFKFIRIINLIGSQ